MADHEHRTDHEVITIPPPAPNHRIPASAPSIISAPPLSTFTSHFNSTSLSTPTFLPSPLGNTAVYDFPPLSTPHFSTTTTQTKKLLFIHGINTPALGLLPLVRTLQHRHHSTPLHAVFYDLWGHGLSDTPLVAHTAELFGVQLRTVLEGVGWSRSGTSFFSAAADAAAQDAGVNVDIIAYSFGCTVLAQLAATGRLQQHGMGARIRSITLLAPSGLLPDAWFSQEVEDALSLQQQKRKDQSPKDLQLEKQAQDTIMTWLEGGPLTVPDDWREWITAHGDGGTDGATLALALKRWELDHHRGYSASVLSMIRHGGVRRQEEAFRALAALSDDGDGGHQIKIRVMLGELDDVVSREKLLQVGFKAGDGGDDLVVVQGVGHGLVREKERLGVVADVLVRFLGG